MVTSPDFYAERLNADKPKQKPLEGIAPALSWVGLISREAEELAKTTLAKRLARIVGSCLS